MEGRASAPSCTLRLAPVSLFSLPKEIRNKIYGYVYLTAPTWIGAASIIDDKNAQVDDFSAHKEPAQLPGSKIPSYDTSHKPSVFVKSKTSLVLTCHQLRSEYRDAVWWRYLHKLGPGEHIDVRVRDFRFEHLEHLITCCSSEELLKLYSRRPRSLRRKLHIRLYLNHVSPRWWSLKRRRAGDEVIQKPIREWAIFVQRTGLRAEYAVDRLATSYAGRMDLPRVLQCLWEYFEDDTLAFSIYRAFMRARPVYGYGFGTQVIYVGPHCEGRMGLI